MICLAISILPFAALAPSAVPRGAAEEPGRHYTIQVLSVRIESRQALLSVYRSLRAEGHLAYYYPKRLGDRRYLRLRVGIFDQRTQAQAYARELAQREGLDYFVATADVPVAPFGGHRRIVTTPSGIWLQSEGAARELYTPAEGWIDLEHTTPQTSPDGAALAFYADHRILKITLDTGETRILRQSRDEDDLLHSVLRWSPDGRYLAYLDTVAWEFPTKLWVMRADGAEDRCLIGDETGQTKVKSLTWHPQKNCIYYVAGPTHGTVSLGGSLCCVDLDGTRQTLIAAQPREGTEVLSEFRLADGVLHYCIVHHDPNGGEPHYSFHARLTPTD